MKEQAVKEIKTISTRELAERLKQNSSLEFWNVLTREYYSGENIAGSRHVPLDLIGRETQNKNIPKETEIVIYCAGPERPQSAMAVRKLETLGYMNAVAYEGGLEEWEAAGLPIERDEPQVAVAADEKEQSTAGCGCCGGKNLSKIETEKAKTMNQTTETNNQVTTVTAPEIVCGGCASSIKKAFGNVEGVSGVEVDVATKKVTVNHNGQVSRERIVDALDRAGYSVES
jgi:copper chaperone CopZ/rhodanese-related sulfurtransferase